MSLGASEPEARRPTPKRAVFIVGSGRSGTSALACALQSLGMQVPQPEVPADETNPKGFGESQWVVDLHDRLLRRANVRMADARPQAWLDTGRISTLERPRDEVLSWLESQYSDNVHEVVLKDPRLVWFLGLWRSAVLRAGIEAGYAVVLRPPAEVVGSKQRYYPSDVSEVSRAASWVNQMLHTERATRGSRRSFILYSDLLDDWTVPLYRLGEEFGLDAVQSATARDLRRIHDLIDPQLHRVRTTWDDIAVPHSLRVLIDETWHHLCQLVLPGGELPDTHQALDQVRHEYLTLYEDAEAITASSILAARRKKPANPPVKKLASSPDDEQQSDPPSERRRGLRKFLTRA